MKKAIAAIAIAIAITFGAVAWAQTIDINKAGLVQLQGLPNVGAKRAMLIVRYRQIKGEFSSVEDLYAIPGLGRKTVEGIMLFATVGETKED